MYKADIAQQLLQPPCLLSRIRTGKPCRHTAYILWHKAVSLKQCSQACPELTRHAVESVRQAIMIRRTAENSVHRLKRGVYKQIFGFRSSAVNRNINTAFLP